MDYQKHYDKLINRAKARLLEGYKEEHHIRPKCLGGSDDIENLVNLTAEEHLTAHLLLVKIYPKEKDLIFAAKMMSVDPHGFRITNKLYGWLKKRHSDIMRAGFAKEMRSKRKNGPMSEDTKKKISESNTGKVVSEDTRKIISERTKAGMDNPETKRKQRDAKLGKPGNSGWHHKEESRQVIREKRAQQVFPDNYSETLREAQKRRLEKERNDPTHKFSNENIRKILDLLEQGVSQTKIAKQLGVSQPFVSQVKLRKVVPK